jgi:hypothetical protein
MRWIALKRLRIGLGEYIRLVVGGKRGHASIAEDKFIAQVVREGWLTPAKDTSKGPLLRGKPVMSFEELMADLHRDREDR